MTSFVRGNDGIFLYAARACLAKYAWTMPFSIEHKNKDARKIKVNYRAYRIYLPLSEELLIKVTGEALISMEV